MRTGEIDEVAFHDPIRGLAKDIQENRVQVVTLGEADKRAATALLETHGITESLRTTAGLHTHPGQYSRSASCMSTNVPRSFPEGGGQLAGQERSKQTPFRYRRGLAEEECKPARCVAARCLEGAGRRPDRRGLLCGPAVCGNHRAGGLFGRESGRGRDTVVLSIRRTLDATQDRTERKAFWEQGSAHR